MPEIVLDLIVSFPPFCILTWPPIHSHISIYTCTQLGSQSSNIKSQEGRKESILLSIAAIAIVITPETNLKCLGTCNWPQNHCMGSHRSSLLGSSQHCGNRAPTLPLAPSDPNSSGHLPNSRCLGQLAASSQSPQS